MRRKRVSSFSVLSPYILDEMEWGCCFVSAGVASGAEGGGAVERI